MVQNRAAANCANDCKRVGSNTDRFLAVSPPDEEKMRVSSSSFLSMGMGSAQPTWMSFPL